MKLSCQRCGRLLTLEDRVSRQQTCPDCGAYLHCCLNCILYDPAAHHQCRETETEFVQDKKSANFCEYFGPRAGSAAQGSDRAAAARKKLDELFGSDNS